MHAYKLPKLVYTSRDSITSTLSKSNHLKSSPKSFHCAEGYVFSQELLQFRSAIISDTGTVQLAYNKPDTGPVEDYNGRIP